MNDKSTSLHKLQNLDCVIERCHHVAVRCSNLGVRSHADQRCGAYTLVDAAEGLCILDVYCIILLFAGFTCTRNLVTTWHEWCLLMSFASLLSAVAAIASWRRHPKVCMAPAFSLVKEVSEGEFTLAFSSWNGKTLHARKSLAVESVFSSVALPSLDFASPWPQSQDDLRYKHVYAPAP